MMNWLLLALLATPVKANLSMPSLTTGSWYRHDVAGVSGATDWLCIRRAGPRAEGYWLRYRRGAEPRLEWRLVAAKIRKDSWSIRTERWVAGRFRPQTYWSFESGPRRNGRPSLETLQMGAGSDFNSFCFVSSKPPDFIRTNPKLVFSTFLVLVRHVDEDNARKG